jgi:hypothetical protein
LTCSIEEVALPVQCLINMQHRGGGSECAGLARTLFMEDRARCGPAIDLPAGQLPSIAAQLPSAAARLPSAAQLAHLARDSGEFAVAWRAGRAFGRRLVPAAAPAPRPVAKYAPHAAIVAGGTKARLHPPDFPVHQIAHMHMLLFLVPEACRKVDA